MQKVLLDIPLIRDFKAEIKTKTSLCHLKVFRNIFIHLFILD
jgi:hypothetical protein